MSDNINMYVIRKAHPENAAQISELIVSVAHYFSPKPNGKTASWFLASVTPSSIESYIKDPAFNYLAAFFDQSLAGVIAMRDTSHVHHLFVAPAFYRRGIAKQLWAQARADALAAGNSAGFSVRSSEYAVPVYESFGFHVVGEKAEKDGVVFIPMQLKFSV